MGSMNSFYGGPAGKSFAIKKIFTSKNGLTDSLTRDLALGWVSLINVGDFVVVSYGLPSDDNYEIFKKIDLDAEGVSYNSTLWQKCYDENNKQAANGLSYKLIASLTGNTPKFKIKQPITVLDANQKPTVTIDNTDVDQPVITFSLPQSQVLSMIQPVNVLDADQDPRIEYSEENINEPTMEFFLPRSQVIKEASVEEVLEVGSTPEVRLDLATEGGVNNPVLKFKLPASQKISPENVDYEKIDADQSPRVEFSLGNDPNNPTLKFYLPQSQVFADPLALTLDPASKPAVSMDSSHINSPQLTFSLPRAVQFFYGDRLGERGGGPYEDTYADYANYGVGDYYINVPSGFIYRVTAVVKESTQATFEYVACLQSPKPTTGVTPVAPYSYTGGRYEPTNPSVDMQVDDSLHTWSLTFSLPKMPVPTIDSDFIAAPADEGSASVQITDANTIQFSLKIPRGSRLFNGEGNPDAIAEAKNGDYYVDTKTGKLHLYNGASWDEQPGTLQGPEGNALNVVKEYELTESLDNPNTVASATKVIEKDYPEPTPDQIFSVIWSTQDGDKISYWQYKTKDGTWGRVQLTGGIASILAKEYSTEENKVYNTVYINSLINADQSEKEKTAYSKKAIEDMLTWTNFTDVS